MPSPFSPHLVTNFHALSESHFNRYAVTFASRIKGGASNPGINATLALMAPSKSFPQLFSQHASAGDEETKKGSRSWDGSLPQRSNPEWSRMVARHVHQECLTFLYIELWVHLRERKKAVDYPDFIILIMITLITLIIRVIRAPVVAIHTLSRTSPRIVEYAMMQE